MNGCGQVCSRARTSPGLHVCALCIAKASPWHVFEILKNYSPSMCDFLPSLFRVEPLLSVCVFCGLSDPEFCILKCKALVRWNYIGLISSFMLFISTRNWAHHNFYFWDYNPIYYRLEARVRFPAGQDFSPLHRVQTGSRAHPAAIEGDFPLGKAAGAWSLPLISTSADVKNGGAITPLPLCFHDIALD
jgi:hypothetical protein